MILYGALQYGTNSKKPLHFCKGSGKRLKN